MTARVSMLSHYVVMVDSADNSGWVVYLQEIMPTFAGFVVLLKTKSDVSIERK